MGQQSTRAHHKDVPISSQRQTGHSSRHSRRGGFDDQTTGSDERWERHDGGMLCELALEEEGAVTGAIHQRDDPCHIGIVTFNRPCQGCADRTTADNPDGDLGPGNGPSPSG